MKGLLLFVVKDHADSVSILKSHGRFIDVFGLDIRVITVIAIKLVG